MPAEFPEQAAVLQGLLWLGVVVIAVLLGVAIGSYVKKRSMISSRSSAAAFALEDLRRLRDRGSLTDAEFEALKRKMLDGS